MVTINSRWKSDAICGYEWRSFTSLSHVKFGSLTIWQVISSSSETTGRRIALTVESLHPQVTEPLYTQSCDGRRQQHDGLHCPLFLVWCKHQCHDMMRASCGSCVCQRNASSSSSTAAIGTAWQNKDPMVVDTEGEGACMCAEIPFPSFHPCSAIWMVRHDSRLRYRFTSHTVVSSCRY